MRKKHFDGKAVFAFIWSNCDQNGLWDGSATTLAEWFHVSEDEAQCVLGDLADRGLIEMLYPGRWAIVKWRERDDAGEGKSTC